MIIGPHSQHTVVTPISNCLQFHLKSAKTANRKAQNITVSHSFLQKFVQEKEFPMYWSERRHILWSKSKFKFGKAFTKYTKNFLVSNILPTRCNMTSWQTIWNDRFWNQFVWINNENVNLVFVWFQYKTKSCNKNSKKHWWVSILKLCDTLTYIKEICITYIVFQGWDHPLFWEYYDIISI